MRKVYKDPKELGMCLKDLVDFYIDNVMTYEKLEEKVTILIEANEDRVYKGGRISLKISNILGVSRVEIVNKVFLDKYKQ